MRDSALVLLALAGDTREASAGIIREKEYQTSPLIIS